MIERIYHRLRGIWVDADSTFGHAVELFNFAGDCVVASLGAPGIDQRVVDAYIRAAMLMERAAWRAYVDEAFGMEAR